MASGKPIEIEKTAQWNTTLREATASGQNIFVDFHAEWCGPCKTIAPVYAKLAAQYPQIIFLRVDVDQQRPIASKYQVTAMPTFIVVQAGKEVQRLRGADQRGLTALAQQYSAPPVPPAPKRDWALPAEADAAKDEGNEAFKRGDFVAAVQAYTRAIKVAPQSAVLYGNRSAAYLKLPDDVKLSSDINPQPQQANRPAALQDAIKATELDAAWGKGWIRLGDALTAIVEKGEADNGSEEEKRNKTGRKYSLEGAEEAFENAIKALEGKQKEEAQSKLVEVQKQIKALL